MALLTTKLPSEDQLALLARLCEERGLPMPAPASMQEASLFIDEIKRREYRLAESLSDAEYAYVISRLGEDGPRRLFGV